MDRRKKIYELVLFSNCIPVSFIVAFPMTKPSAFERTPWFLTTFPSTVALVKS